MVFAGGGYRSGDDSLGDFSFSMGGCCSVVEMKIENMVVEIFGLGDGCSGDGKMVAAVAMVVIVDWWTW